MGLAQRRTRGGVGLAVLLVSLLAVVQLELQLLYIVHEKAFVQELCPSVLVGK